MAANRKLIAVLIDGDNAQAELIPLILDEVKQYGNPQIKRVYGDWSGSLAKNWQAITTRYAIETKHRFNTSAGKNATDIALVIDAMDILRDYEDDLHGVCIVSSDSDFSHLATRIRQSGLIVIGVGRESSARLFKDSFDHFISIESLTKRQPDAPKAVEPPTPAETAPAIALDEFGKWFAQGYKNVMARGEFDPRLGVQLRDVRDEMMKLVPNLPSQFQLMPAFVAQTKALASAYPNYLIINGVPEDRPVLHYAQIFFPNDKQTPKTKSATAKPAAIKTAAQPPAKPAAVKSATTPPAKPAAPPPAKPAAVKAVKAPAKPAAVKAVTPPPAKSAISATPKTQKTSVSPSKDQQVLPPEIERIIAAYRHSVEVLKVAKQGGWVSLSPIGSTLRDMFEDADPLVYQGDKHNQLKKVVARIVADYPNLMEIMDIGGHPHIRMK